MDSLAKQLLTEAVTNLIKGDTQTSTAAFSQYAEYKTKQIVNEYFFFPGQEDGTGDFARDPRLPASRGNFPPSSGHAKLVKINSFEDAKRYCRGTRCCLSDQRMYDNYARQGGIYAIVDKGKTVAIVHPSTETYVDADDTLVTAVAIMDAYPELEQQLMSINHI